MVAWARVLMVQVVRNGQIPHYFQGRCKRLCECIGDGLQEKDKSWYMFASATGRMEWLLPEMGVLQDNQVGRWALSEWSKFEMPVRLLNGEKAV